MKLPIDTNVILDVLLNREPFCDTAVKILSLSEKYDVQEYVSASAVTAGVTEKEIKSALELEALLPEILRITNNPTFKYGSLNNC